MRMLVAMCCANQETSLRGIIYWLFEVFEAVTFEKDLDRPAVTL
jgi:hypothetical protein